MDDGFDENTNPLGLELSSQRRQTGRWASAQALGAGLGSQATLAWPLQTLWNLMSVGED